MRSTRIAVVLAIALVAAAVPRETHACTPTHQVAPPASLQTLDIVGVPAFTAQAATPVIENVLTLHVQSVVAIAAAPAVTRLRSSHSLDAGKALLNHRGSDSRLLWQGPASWRGSINAGPSHGWRT